MTKYRPFGDAFGRQTPAEKSAYLLKDPATEGGQRGVERFTKRNRQVTKWQTLKPFFAMPYGERVAIEVLIPPLVDWLRLALGVFIGPLQHKFDEEPQKPPTWLRPLIVEFNDYGTLTLMGLSPLMECMTWDWDHPSADAKLELKVGEEMEAQLAGTESWDEEQRLRAGAWLSRQVLALDLFDMTDNFPKIAAKYLPELDRIREEMIRAHPVHMPLFELPPDWAGWWMKCPGRLRVPFVRKDFWPEHREAIAECLRDPEWEPAKAVNALQSVPFLIDPVMRDLVKRYAVEVMGRTGWERRDDEWQVADDIRTAEYIGDRPFYIPRNVDKRGRINSVCHFNFDRGDHVRSMFRFAWDGA